MRNVQTREIEYQTADGTKLIGYFAAPKDAQDLAAVIVAPEWWGRTEYTEQRARELAEHGYAALAIDMYGDKKVTTSAEQANAWMSATFAEPNIIVDRARAGLDALAQQPEVNPQQLAAIGFCYGGKVVLDLARAGADLKAVATFHGNLSTEQPAAKGVIQGEVVAFHGEDDTMVSLDDVKKFEAEMQAAEVKHQVVILKDAKHGFSNPLADERAKANQVDLGYNAEAEQDSLAQMYALLERNL